MSYLYRWARHNQSLAARSAALLKQGHILESTSTTPANLTNIRPLYRITPANTMSTTPPMMVEQKGKPKGPTPGKDDPNYVIKIKDISVKTAFKQFYSLYGPLFVVCHIGIALTSLGFFCSLTYFAIDLDKYIPDVLFQFVGEQIAAMTGTGGKFVLAYAIHKAILLPRLVGALYLTRFLSKYIKRVKPQS